MLTHRIDYQLSDGFTAALRLAPHPEQAHLDVGARPVSKAHVPFGCPVRIAVAAGLGPAKPNRFVAKPPGVHRCERLWKHGIDGPHQEQAILGCSITDRQSLDVFKAHRVVVLLW